jgi:mRNA interferase RelE/StbE
MPDRAKPGTVRYKIKLHKEVVTEDSRQFDEKTKEKIKKKCKELLGSAPEQVGAPLHFELKEYRKLVIFDKYRIIYRVHKREVMVFILAVGIRRDSEVYRKAVKRLQRTAH